MRKVELKHRLDAALRVSFHVYLVLEDPLWDFSCFLDQMCFEKVCSPSYCLPAERFGSGSRIRCQELFGPVDPGTGIFSDPALDPRQDLSCLTSKFVSNFTHCLKGSNSIALEKLSKA
jgi:hypothetical protein